MKLVFKKEIDLKDKIILRYVQLSSIRQDFIDSKRMAEILTKTMVENIQALQAHDTNLETLVNAIWKGFIITYMKSFSRSEFRMVISIKETIKILGNDPELINMHDHLVRLRNEHIAHYDESIHSILKVYGEIREDENNSENINYKFNSEGTRTHYPSTVELPTYIKLCDIFIAHYTGEVEKMLPNCINKYQSIHLKEHYPGKSFSP